MSMIRPYGVYYQELELIPIIRVYRAKKCLSFWDRDVFQDLPVLGDDWFREREALVLDCPTHEGGCDRVQTKNFLSMIGIRAGLKSDQWSSPRTLMVALRKVIESYSVEDSLPFCSRPCEISSRILF